jgi:hypothetical protein
MEWLSDPKAWLGLLSLTALEIVLGIDKINLRLRRHAKPVQLHGN